MIIDHDGANRDIVKIGEGLELVRAWQQCCSIGNLTHLYILTIRPNKKVFLVTYFQL